MPLDYSQKIGLDINAKKLDKVRQLDERIKILFIKRDNIVRAKLSTQNDY